MDKKAVIELVKNYISFLKQNKYAVQKAYLFGSYATGLYNDDSDIDLAIVMKTLDNVFITQVDFMKLRRNFDVRIEPHPFAENDFDHFHPFADEILKTGIQVA